MGRREVWAHSTYKGKTEVQEGGGSDAVATENGETEQWVSILGVGDLDISMQNFCCVPACLKTAGNGRT